MSLSEELLYGGAAGGGKSDFLLMAALQFVDLPDYSALLLRRSYPDLALPGAIMARAHDWLRGKIRWVDTEKTYYFPSGATLTFGYLQHEDDKYRYQSAEFQFIGFDELTQFSQAQYRYLFSRLRRQEGSTIPLRMRAASNPGGQGHQWVKDRFIPEGFKAIDGMANMYRHEGRIFLPARLQDNPFLDREQYIRKLQHLDPITRQRLLDGDWTVSEGGAMFKRHWFRLVQDWPRHGRQVRFWDLAASKPKRGQEPDYTVGCRMAESGGQYWIIDIRRVQDTPGEVEKLIRQTAALDGYEVPIRMEQEPGASGKIVIDHYAREALKGYDFAGIPSTGDKAVRAAPLSSAAEMGNVFLVEGAWVEAMLDEFEVFPAGAHDDQVDAASGAYAYLSRDERQGAYIDLGILGYADVGV